MNEEIKNMIKNWDPNNNNPPRLDIGISAFILIKMKTSPILKKPRISHHAVTKPKINKDGLFQCYSCSKTFVHAPAMIAHSKKCLANSVILYNDLYYCENKNKNENKNEKLT